MPTLSVYPPQEGRYAETVSLIRLLCRLVSGRDATEVLSVSYNATII